MADDLKLLRPADLGAEQLRAAARLVRLALPDFYAPLGDDRAEAAIEAQLLEPGNELSDAVCSLSGDSVSGILCAYPAREQADRQRAGLHLLGGTLDREDLARLFAHLQTFREQVGPVAPRGMYLARIAVDERCRGTPLAGALLGRLIDEAGPEGVSLHVRADNHRATAFYRRLGFMISTEDGKDYRIMERR